MQNVLSRSHGWPDLTTEKQVSVDTSERAILARINRVYTFLLRAFFVMVLLSIMLLAADLVFHPLPVKPRPIPVQTGSDAGPFPSDHAPCPRILHVRGSVGAGSSGFVLGDAWRARDVERFAFSQHGAGGWVPSTSRAS